MGFLCKPIICVQFIFVSQIYLFFTFKCLNQKIYLIYFKYLNFLLKKLRNDILNLIWKLNSKFKKNLREYFQISETKCILF